MAEDSDAVVDHLMTQPHELWKQLRAAAPVQSAGADTPMERETFMVMRHADVEAVLRDADTFSSSIHHEMMGPVMGEAMIGMDGQEHRDHRDLVAKAFRASALERWGSELIEPSIHSLLDRIAPLGRSDLVRDITAQFPVQVIAGILGVPVTDYEEFQDWADGITSIAVDPERAAAASDALIAYMLPIIEARRENPGDDLVSDLVTAEIDGNRLTDEAQIDGHLLVALRIIDGVL
jgi:cytochrome P450